MSANKNLVGYLLKFIVCFCVLYYGTLAVMGLVSPSRYYMPFLHDYFNYISWLRNALLYSSKALLRLLGCPVYLDGPYVLRLYRGPGVHLVYSCLGFGVMSFWIAFVYANDAGWLKKIRWIAAGILLIFFINVWRIALLVIAMKHRWTDHVGIDNHTLFNIVAYILVFVMMYLFHRSVEKQEVQ